jgi:hypothetical protein
MESIFTPIVAQSSLDASLINIDIGALCGTEGGGFIAIPPEPPLHAAVTAPARLSANNRNVFETMTGFSSNLTISNFCRMRRFTGALLQASTAQRTAR